MAQLAVAVDRLVDRGISPARRLRCLGAVYVYFDAKGFPGRSAASITCGRPSSVDTILDSVFQPGEVLVVESGSASLGQWRTVTRNIEDDYQRCFGGKLPEVVAIGPWSIRTTPIRGGRVFDDVMVTRHRRRVACPAVLTTT